MFLRHVTVRKKGKVHTYWRLVRSVRMGGKVKQEVVAQLGELDAKGRLTARKAAELLVGKERTPGLFDPLDPSLEFQEPLLVDVKGLRLERGRRFGDIWLGLRLWQALGLDKVCGQLMPEGRELIPWEKMVALLVVLRLCDPSSELEIAESLLRSTALGDLLGLEEERVNDDRLYRALDKLLEQKEALESHLSKRLQTMFGLEYDLLLYDITSTYFEGQAESNSLAARGYSRDHRSDCKQVCIGLVVTREGYPLGYEVFKGNRSDSTTMREIVERMESKFGVSGRIWAMDRGMVSESHVNWLKARGSRYILGTAKGSLSRYQHHLLEGDWHEIREGLEVKWVPATESDEKSGQGEESYILCRSRDRGLKERAMREKFEARMEMGLEKLRAQCERGRISVSAVERGVGRLLGKNTRAGRYFEIRVFPNEKGKPCLDWKKKEISIEESSKRDGCYLLRTNVMDWTHEELWKAYIHLTDVEAAFRIQKGELGLRPVWHQKSERVEGHILVCFLAYALQKTLEGWTNRRGLGKSPRKVLKELERIQSADVMLPILDGRMARIRCVIQPEKALKTLLEHLGLELPKRLQTPKMLRDMLAPQTKM